MTKRTRRHLNKFLIDLLIVSIVHTIFHFIITARTSPSPHTVAIAEVVESM